jgi:flagellar protein FlaG
MASPIDNIANTQPVVKTVKAVRDSGAKEPSRSQQSQQVGIQPDNAGLEKVNEIPTNSSLDLADVMQRVKNNESLKKSIEQILNEYEELYGSDSSLGNRQISFDVDTNTGDIIIKIVEKDTNKLIRQIPSEEAMKLMERLREYSDKAGLLIDTEA